MAYDSKMDSVGPRVVNFVSTLGPATIKGVRAIQMQVLNNEINGLFNGCDTCTIGILDFV